MRCPRCEVADLLMMDRRADRGGLLPDLPRRVLDRGELDKVIERTAVPLRASARVPMPPSAYGYRREDDDEYKKKRKRGGVLGDIFDF